MGKRHPTKRKAIGSRGSLHAPPTNAFQPGNPGGPGRPKDDPELIEAFRARTPQALATLDKVMADFAANKLTPKGDPLVPSQAAVKAAEVTLNRGWGSAPQTIKLDANVTADVKHDIKAEVVQSPERMRTIIAVLKRAGQLEENTETAAPVETKEQS
jgi:hypothetical protein